MTLIWSHATNYKIDTEPFMSPKIAINIFPIGKKTFRNEMKQKCINLILNMISLVIEGADNTLHRFNSIIFLCLSHARIFFFLALKGNSESNELLRVVKMLNFTI